MPERDTHSAVARLELVDVAVTYPNGFEAVHAANLSVDRGEIVALLGASGSGKSTLLRAVAGLERVTRGDVRVDGASIVNTPVHQRNIGLVFQDGQLFAHRNVGRNIAYGLEMRGEPRERITRRVGELLDLVELSGYEQRAVTTLSGGQAQRVALARSLAPKPRILLLDEPLSALDRNLRETLAVQLREILTQTGTTAVFVTHDEAEAQTVADRTVSIVDGLLPRFMERH